MSTPTTFATLYNVGDTIYCFDDLGRGQQTTIAALNFRIGYNPLAYVGATDMLYTTALLTADGLSQVWRPEGLVFADHTAMKTYIDSLP